MIGVKIRTSDGPSLNKRVIIQKRGNIVSASEREGFVKANVGELWT